VQVAKNRPVLVFFTTIDMVNEFYMSDQFKTLKGNSITLTERNDADATKTRIIRAARAKNITIMTRAFGRGIDFVVGEKDVKDAGGIHVIQTFIS
jgi:preprotein translocase subunit SecA